MKLSEAVCDLGCNEVSALSVVFPDIKAKHGNDSSAELFPSLFKT